MRSEQRFRRPPSRAGRLLLFLLVAVVLYGAGLISGHYGLFPTPQLVSASHSLTLFDDRLRIDADATKSALRDAWLDDSADVVMVGDSLTAGGRWDEFYPLVTVANRGIGGDTVTGVYRRVPHILAKRPRQIFLMIGINDVMAGSAEDAIAGRYDAIVAALAPHSHVYVQSILACGAPRCGRAVNRRITALNGRLEKIAAAHGAEFVDLNEIFARDGSLRPELTDDGVHLNGAGYRLWRDRLAILICPAADCPVAGRKGKPASQ